MTDERDQAEAPAVPAKPKRKRAKKLAHKKTTMDARYGPPVTTSVRLPAGLLSGMKTLARRRESSVNGEVYEAIVNRLSEEGLLP